jgi:uncharacterized membrane protein
MPAWRREALRTNLWIVPAVEVAGAILLFAVTYAIDRAATDGTISLPSWVDSGSADAARQILIGIAAAVITVLGLVFSITIVALTLASTQFGPRMLRNFIRDRGTQVTLGTFVASFVFAVLALGSVTSTGGGHFVPHFSITVALVLVLADIGVLVFFIDHVAKSIQLPNVIAGIADDLARSVRNESRAHREAVGGERSGASTTFLIERIQLEGAPVLAPNSGYLQFVAFPSLVEIAADADATIRMLHRPGHFVVEGLPLADVWPPEAADAVALALGGAHATGAHRTLSQDLAFAIDQLVEIAIRALSPAVNDTFTGMTCVDWLGDALCKIASQWESQRVYRDRSGQVRVIAQMPTFERLVDRSFDKIRQAGRGMPAILIRQLESLTRVCDYATERDQLVALSRQAAMILRAASESIPEPADEQNVRDRYERFTRARRAAEARTAALSDHA